MKNMLLSYTEKTESDALFGNLIYLEFVYANNPKWF